MKHSTLSITYKPSIEHSRLNIPLIGKYAKCWFSRTPLGFCLVALIVNNSITHAPYGVIIFWAVEPKRESILKNGLHL